MIKQLATTLHQQIYYHRGFFFFLIKVKLDRRASSEQHIPHTSTTTWCHPATLIPTLQRTLFSNREKKREIQPSCIGYIRYFEFKRKIFVRGSNLEFLKRFLEMYRLWTTVGYTSKLITTIDSSSLSLHSSAKKVCLQLERCIKWTAYDYPLSCLSICFLVVVVFVCHQIGCKFLLHNFSCKYNHFATYRFINLTLRKRSRSSHLIGNFVDSARLHLQFGYRCIELCFVSVLLYVLCNCFVLFPASNYFINLKLGYLQP